MHKPGSACVTSQFIMTLTDYSLRSKETADFISVLHSPLLDYAHGTSLFAHARKSSSEMA